MFSSSSSSSSRRLFLTPSSSSSSSSHRPLPLPLSHLQLRRDLPKLSQNRRDQLETKSWMQNQNFFFQICPNPKFSICPDEDDEDDVFDLGKSKLMIFILLPSNSSNFWFSSYPLSSPSPSFPLPLPTPPEQDRRREREALMWSKVELWDRRLERNRRRRAIGDSAKGTNADWKWVCRDFTGLRASSNGGRWIEG